MNPLPMKRSNAHHFAPVGVDLSSTNPLLTERSNSTMSFGSGSGYLQRTHPRKGGQTGEEPITRVEFRMALQRTRLLKSGQT